MRPPCAHHGATPRGAEHEAVLRTHVAALPEQRRFCRSFPMAPAESHNRHRGSDSAMIRSALDDTFVFVRTVGPAAGALTELIRRQRRAHGLGSAHARPQRRRAMTAGSVRLKISVVISVVLAHRASEVHPHA
eukprot:SAG11_NODE_241_length_11781_cov_8.401900_4_plen_133_part_00